MKKFYAIKVGNNVQNLIVESWKECQKYVIGYPSIYKSFKTKQEAKRYLQKIQNFEIARKLEIAKIHKIKRVGNKIQQRYNFYIPEYVIQEIAEKSNYETICAVIDFANQNEDISLKNANILKNELKLHSA